MNRPNGAATDGSGNVYVADFTNDRIEKFDSSGNFIEAWGWGVLDGASKLEVCTASCRAGISGGGAGQVTSPAAVATDAAGNVYVADSAQQRIDKFDSSGNFIEAWGWGVLDHAGAFEKCTTASGCMSGSGSGGAGGLSGPYAIAIDSSGYVYVADVTNERIDKFDTSGNFIEAWGWDVIDDGTSPDPQGNPPPSFEICTTATGCQQGAAGAGAGQLYNPYGVAVDSAGNVYVANQGLSSISKFDSAANFLTSWGTYGDGAGQMVSPQQLATDFDGNIYVADETNHRIDVFSSSGSFILTWGRSVDKTSSADVCTAASGDTCQAGTGGDGAGQFYSPTALALDSAGNVYVADVLEFRVDKFAVTLHNPLPSVSQVFPSSGPAAGGASVSIVGQNFRPGATVKFGVASAQVQGTPSSSVIDVVVPPGAGTVDVTVTTPDGTSATNPSDQYTYEPPPAVTPPGGSGGGTPISQFPTSTLTLGVPFGPTRSVPLLSAQPVGEGVIGYTQSGAGGKATLRKHAKLILSYLSTADPTGELRKWYLAVSQGTRGLAKTLTVTASAPPGAPSTVLTLTGVLPAAFSMHFSAPVQTADLTVIYAGSRISKLPSTTGPPTVAGGHITVPVACQAIARSCIGSLTLKGNRAGHHPLTLGSSHYVVPSGSTQTVTVRPNTFGRRLLNGTGVLTVVFLSTGPGSAGTVTTQHVIHLRRRAIQRNWLPSNFSADRSS